MVLVFFTVIGCGEDEKPLRPSAPLPAPPGQAVTAREGLIVAVGDSLTAGYRVAEEHAYPAILQQRLTRDGRQYDVINAGISGETSSGTLARLDWILTLQPDIMILETGGNDGLRGIDPQLTRENIDRIVTRLKAKGVIVILAGMRMVKNLGETFTNEFESLYPVVAAKHDVILIPFFLEAVAANRQLNQADGIHPTPEGYRRVVDHIYPFVAKGIQQFRQKQ
ncbi:MAG: arylesterase [Desulfobacterales bacterium]|nr:arylesterase [Desulfobacterales bacterium]